MRTLLFSLLLIHTISAQIPCFDMDILRPLATEDHPPYRHVHSMQYTADGNLLVCGTNWDGTQVGRQFWVAKMTPSGQYYGKTRSRYSRLIFPQPFR